MLDPLNKVMSDYLNDPSAMSHLQDRLINPFKNPKGKVIKMNFY